MQQQKLRTMNICPDLERKLCLCVCVSARELKRVIHRCTQCLSMQAYEASQEHGSLYLDDVRLSSRPAVSPLPVGVSPFIREILGIPASWCRSFLYMVTVVMDAPSTMLTITGRQLRLQSCHYHAIVAQRFPASVTPAPPPLSEGGVSQRQRKLWVFPAAAWGGRRSPGWGSGNVEVFAVVRSTDVMFWEFCCLSLYLWHHLQAHFPQALWN